MTLWAYPYSRSYQRSSLEDFFETTAPPFHYLPKLKELDEFHDALNAKKLHNFYRKLLRYQPYKISESKKR